MSGFLPATRPTSANYGPTFKDEKPVELSEYEVGAATVNAIKDDVAYCARMAPLARIKITNSGAAAVASIVGPEGATVGQVTVTRTAPGKVTVDWTLTGLTVVAALAFAQHASDGRVATNAYNIASSSCKVWAFDMLNGVDVDSDFILELF